MFVPATDTERTVFAFFAALGSGRFDDLRETMAADMTWTVMGRGVPGEGTHVGADAIVATILPIRALFTPGSPVITPRSVTSNAQRVVLETHGGGQLADDRPYDNHYVMVVEVSEGKVTALREYMDTYYVNRLNLLG